MQISILDKEGIVERKTKEQISDLYKQLNPNKQQLELREILNTNNPVVIACCYVEDKIVGIASMANYKVISGNKGWIEDVVVDQNYRGMGIGRKLVEKLLNLAKEQKLSEVLLFTESHRNEAIKLYESLNFHKKGSDIYTLKR